MTPLLSQTGQHNETASVGAYSQTCWYTFQANAGTGVAGCAFIGCRYGSLNLDTFSFKQGANMLSLLYLLLVIGAS